LKPIASLSVFWVIICCLMSEVIFGQVQFIENRGQWNPKVKYMSAAGDGNFYLEEKGFTVSQYNPGDVFNFKEAFHQRRDNPSRKFSEPVIRSHAYKVEFVNASRPEIVASKPLNTVNNYFIGDDPSKWAPNCKIYQVVTYKNVYPGIDVQYFVDGGTNLNYDFIVHPGADPGKIVMKYSGTQKLAVEKKELIISTPLGKSRSLKPYSYQLDGNDRVTVENKYEIRGNEVRFKIKNYDPSKVLVIDPTEIFFSYSGSTADNWGFTATFGRDGSFYGGGIVFGQGFPTSPGSYHETFNGGEFDIGIIKLTPDGKNRVYATYIGGSGREQPHSLIEDPGGNLIVAGRTSSADYPVVPARGASSGAGGGYDIVVTKLNATGSAIIGSVRIGGSNDDGVNIGDEESQRGGALTLKRNYGDDARSEVLLDGNGNIYVASCTTSGNFPVTSGAVQPKLAGGQDGVLIKLSPNCQNILYSTYLGGSKDDAAYVLAIDKANDVYVGGATASSDFYGISPSGVIKSTYSAPGATNDPADGFVLQLSSDGTKVMKGTYIGTGRADEVYGLDIDKNGFLYVMGTSVGNMPVINALYSNAGAKQFISKLQPDLSAYVYSTVFGSTNAPVPNISPTAFMVDRCENVYVSGWGGKPNSSFTGGDVIGMPVTPNAIKTQTDGSGTDFYFFVLEKNATSQLYGSFFGENDPQGPTPFGDHVDGGTSRFDSRGYIYQAICANCGKSVPFPGTPGSWSPTNQAGGPAPGGLCNLGMLKIEMDFTGVRAALQVLINNVPNDTTGCVPLTVQFRDTAKKGKLFYWDFGDGTGDTTTVPNTSHFYSLVGQYNVRLIAIDSSTCNISDTTYQTIHLGDNKVTPDFVSTKIPPCTNLAYSFTNTSTAVSGTFDPGIFTWDFGDGSPVETHNFADVVQHSYGGTGTYNVTLTVTDDKYCNSPGDTVKVIRLSPQVKSAFATPPAGCAPYQAIFTNNSLGGLDFVWDFGDGNNSTDVAPTHLYTVPGNYTIKLYAFDSTSCNKVDSSFATITVGTNPTAAFSYLPTVPQENVFTQFTNLSSGAVSYLWNFGDGDTTNEVNPRHIFPATATYTVCLTSTNQLGCSVDTCMPVKSLIRPLLDVPNAFTPGKFGINSRIGVVGFGIIEMQWNIYNRWGQKVFSTNSTKTTWDGTFNGKPQPMDVYSYTLKVTFSDGTKTIKTGDITLIR